MAEPETGDAAYAAALASERLNDRRNAQPGIGCIASASFTPAAAAYGAADVVDVAKEFGFIYADGTPVPAGSLIKLTASVLKIDQTALQSSEGAYVLYLYSETPPSAQADNAAWALASADLPSYRASLALGTPVDLGAACHIRVSGLDVPIKLGSGKTSLFGALVTTPAFTFTAVARQVTLYGEVR